MTTGNIVFMLALLIGIATTMISAATMGFGTFAFGLGLLIFAVSLAVLSGIVWLFSQISQPASKKPASTSTMWD